jgi:hypothetical protein
MLLTVSFSCLGLYPACSGPTARITDAKMLCLIKFSVVVSAVVSIVAKTSKSSSSYDVGDVARDDVGDNANRATVPTLLNEAGAIVAGVAMVPGMGPVNAPIDSPVDAPDAPVAPVDAPDDSPSSPLS